MNDIAYPNAPAKLINSQWVVQKCPYCGGKHFHGAGGDNVSKEEARKLLGHRASHCIKELPNNVGYILVES